MFSAKFPRTRSAFPPILLFSRSLFRSGVYEHDDGVDVRFSVGSFTTLADVHQSRTQEDTAKIKHKDRRKRKERTENVEKFICERVKTRRETCVGSEGERGRTLQYRLHDTMTQLREQIGQLLHSG